MAQQVKVWFDAEGDFLEVRFSEKAGYMREATNNANPIGVKSHWGECNKMQIIMPNVHHFQYLITTLSNRT